MTFACDFCALKMRSTPSLRRRRRVALVAAVFSVGLLMMIAFHTAPRFGQSSDEVSSRFASEEGSNATNAAVSAPHRKLLRRAAAGAGGVDEPNRIWGDNKCSTTDIVINQGPTPPLPSGIPTYTVEIMNACVTGCDISAIHLSCGWFSSARLINPRIFRRLRFNDCLVNDGEPLANGDTISFEYANSFRYPLSVSSVIC